MHSRIWIVWGLLGVGACVDIPAQTPEPIEKLQPDQGKQLEQGPDSKTPDEGLPDSGPMACQPACESPQVCNPSTGLCVACLTNLECETSSTGPHCLDGLCVECKTSEDCALNQVCLPNHACAECETSENCTFDPARDKCLDNTCVECLTNSDCPEGLGQCFKNRCVECKEEFDCLTKSGLLRCQLDLNRCVSCTVDEHCDLASAQPHCGSDFTCQGCKTTADCNYPGYSLSCEPSTGRCRFTCTNAAMCAAGEICSPEGICLPL